MHQLAIHNEPIIGFATVRLSESHPYIHELHSFALLCYVLGI